MAPHSIFVAWRIPSTEEPGGLVHEVAKSVWDRTEGLTLSLLSLFLKEEEDNLPPLLPS